MVAACDVDKNRLRDAVNTINQHYGNNDCAAYHDYREMLARPDLDAVLIAVPDNWHALVATEAARHGLDIYGEKPLARTIAEQQAIVKAVQANNLIWQTGSWQRSQAPFHKAAEIVRNGLIGDITRVEVGLPGGQGGAPRDLLQKLAALPDRINSLSKVTPGTEAWKLAVSDPPAELDYEMWIGPAQMEPYIAARVHYNWRWNYNTGGGQLLDWIGHHCDIAHWGMDCDNDGPSEIEGQGEFPAKDAICNTAGRYRIELKYPKNITMVIAGGYNDIRSGAKWIGTEGWVWVDRGGFDASNPDWKTRPKPAGRTAQSETLRVAQPLPEFPRLREIPQAHHRAGGTAHHSAIPGHLGSDFHAHRPEDPVEREDETNPRRCRGQQDAHARLSRARGIWPNQNSATRLFMAEFAGVERHRANRTARSWRKVAGA